MNRTKALSTIAGAVLALCLAPPSFSQMPETGTLKIRQLPGFQADAKSPDFTPAIRVSTPLIRPAQEPAPIVLPQKTPIDQDSLARELNALQQDPQEGIVRPASQRPIARPITEMNLDISKNTGRLPEDRSLTLLEHAPSDWFSFQPTPMLVFWDAPNICYRRLYFEDPVLERYGRSAGPAQDLLRSTAHFSTSLMIWPLRGVADAPGVCDTPLGYCRPGSTVPCYREKLISR